MGGLGDVLAALSVLSAVLAIVGAGALVASLGFAWWAADIVATFFESRDSKSNDGDPAARLQRQFDVSDGEGLDCPHCNYPMSHDTTLHAIYNGYCPKCGGDI